MIPRTLSTLSSGLSAIERLVLKLLIAAMSVSVLLNVLLRMIGITLAWADEVGVLCMIMAGFVGASLMLRARIDPAVLLLHEFLPAKACRLLRIMVSSLSAAFGIALLYLCIRWFNPVEMLKAGFEVMTFQGATFNFIYTDITPIMGLPSFYFYLVIPAFAFAITIHALTNLCEDMGLIDRPHDPAGLAMDTTQ